jgi:hypothetical protein
MCDVVGLDNTSYPSSLLDAQVQHASRKKPEGSLEQACRPNNKTKQSLRAKSRDLERIDRKQQREEVEFQ